MTPYEIEIALHYYSRTDDWHGPSYGNELHTETIANFLELGLLKPTGLKHPASYERTERLDAYAEALQKVNLPVQMWVTPLLAEYKP